MWVDWATTQQVDVALGAIANVCWALCLLPQVLENHRNATTEGLSIGLVLLWHGGSALLMAFNIALGEYIIASSLVTYALFSSFILGQREGYRSCSCDKVAPLQQESDSLAGPAATRSHPWAIICRRFCLVVILTTAATCCLVLVFQRWPQVGTVFGSVGSSSTFAVGFLPQYMQFLRSWSTQGYSLALSVMDFVGSTADLLIAMMDAGWHLDLDLLWTVSPFLTQIVFHSGIFVLAAVIACFGERTPREANGTEGAEYRML